MWVKILGAAAGGGFPQWNCQCPGCQAVREGQIPALLQSSIAVRSAADPWLLVNASPDVRQQLESLRDARFPGVRCSPIAAVLLTDAEIDHTAGLMVLREATTPLPVYSTPAVKQALLDGFPVLRTLEHYCGVAWSALEIGTTLLAESPNLEVDVFPLSTKPPKYMRSLATVEAVWAIGFTIRDRTTRGVLTYAPVLAELSNDLLARFEASDCILVDGTFWRNDELCTLGCTERLALEMGHLPLSGAEGTLQALKQLNCDRKILVHINNTNPILRPRTQERQSVEAMGFEVGYDGLTLEL